MYKSCSTTYYYIQYVKPRLSGLAKNGVNSCYHGHRNVYLLCMCRRPHALLFKSRWIKAWFIHSIILLPYVQREILEVPIFVEWLERPSKEMFTVQCQETTPTTSFACEIPVRGSSFSFICPRKTQKFPAIRYPACLRNKGVRIMEVLRINNSCTFTPPSGVIRTV